MDYRVLNRKVYKYLTVFYCEHFHGGGHIIRDNSGKINWQCAKCGRLADPENCIIL